MLCAAWACGGSSGAQSGTGDNAGATEVKGLKTARAFAGIANPEERSVALFLEVNRVLSHPRCVNCHPGDGRPRQGDEGRMHDPPIFAGADGKGAPAMPCQSCHQKNNFSPAGVPGAPNWHLAPDSMGWLGHGPAELCRRIKDPNHNGNKTLDAIVHHVGHDELVGWGWDPGGTREPAPGDQATAGGLMKAWQETGAHCPKEQAE